jgi:hypothetical protein
MVKIGVAACVMALTVGGLSIAQQGGGGGGRRGGGNFDPAQMRQRMADNLKQQLGADDQAWKVMEPRVMKVWELNMQANAGRGRGMMGGRRGGQGGQAGDQGGDQQGQRRGGGPGADTALGKAMANLQTVLDNQSASPDDIKKALTTVREAKMKAQQELAAAQDDLKKILTVRQEAVLVTMGLMN